MRAKTKLTRLCSILLTLVLVVGLLPTAALAAEPATGTADFTTDSTTALDLLNTYKTGEADSTWDADSKTLTLNGVNFTTTAATAVKLPDGATIVLADGTTNTITGGSNSEYCYGIYGEGDLTISGTGTLNVTGGDADYYASHGIYADTNVKISGGTVTATGGDTYNDSFGIYAYSKVTISGGTVTATGGYAEYDSYGIYAYTSNVTISGGTVTTTGGYAEYDNSYGIYAYNSNVTISGGTVTATGGTAYEDSAGIYAYNDVTISGGTVTATGDAGYNSYGIFADDNVTITGGTVTATGGTADDCSYGIDGSVTITGGTVTATGGYAEWYSDGIDGSVTISGGIVTATGGTADDYSAGIDGSVTISGGAVIAKAGSAPTAAALTYSVTPPTAYWWRTEESGEYIQSSDTEYDEDGSAAHLEIWNWDPTATADFTADANAALALLNAAKTGGAADSTWEVDGSGNHTLTLKGVHFVTSADTAVKLPDGATIVLADGTTNTITGGYADYDSYGIYGEGDLTISGTGTLNVTAVNTEHNASYGIYTDDGDINITGGTVTATGGNAGYYSYGIYAYSNVTISGGTVTATGGNAGYYSYGIYTDDGDINITGGTVNATSGYAYYYSHGIYVYNNMTISGGTVTATGGTADDSYGIDGNVTITGGTVTATGGNATDYSAGIDAYSNMTITGGTVTATGGNAGYGSYGIFADFTVTISGGIVTATGGNATAKSYGIYTDDGDINITGGAVIAKAGSAPYAAALYADSVTPPTAYRWRIEKDGEYFEFPGTAYDGSAGTYLEIKSNPTVTFDANGGKVNGKDTDTATTNAAGKLTSLPEPTRDGYTFKEWNTEQNGTGTTVTTSTIFNANTTVYAQWTAATYTVSFAANGGTGTMADVTGISGEYTLPENCFTAPAGKQFKGWSEEPNGEVISETTIHVSEDTTLYAIWEDVTADFTGDADAALALLNAAKTGEADSTWDADSKTLTLNGVNFTNTAAIAVHLPDDATIVLNGENTIKGGDSADNTSYGIYGDGDLTISGTGTLNVTGGDAYYYSYGIYVPGNVTISSGTVTATGGNAESYCSYGIDGDVTITGGTVTATGGNAKYYYSYGIYGNVTISGGTVTATGGTAGNRSSGIYGDVTITDGTVTATGGTVTATGGNTTGEGGESYGIRVDDGNVTISGGTIIANGGTSDDDSFGIYVPNGNVTISGGTVTANGGDAVDSYGIYVPDHHNVTITGGTVTATGGEAEGNSYGICVPSGNLTISGGTVTATGGTAGNASFGIYAYNNLTISGGTVTATGGTATGSSYSGLSCGIWAYNDVTISGGTVTAEGGDAGNKSYGIYAENGSVGISVGISGDTTNVNAKGGTAKYSYGIYTMQNDVVISGGTVTAEGVEAEWRSYGIFAGSNGGPQSGNVSISGGTATAKGAAATYNSYGIYAERSVGISGTARVTAACGTASTMDAIKEYSDNVTIGGHTITFDANGSSGAMMYAEGTPGNYNYTLPENIFTAPAGKPFKGWAFSADGAVISGTSITVTGNTTLYAIWEDIKYNVTVTGGTASATNAAKGTAVTLTAGPAPSGQVFDKWVVVSGSITLADENSATTTFTMPAGDVSVTATYKAAPVTLSGIAITTPPTKTTYAAGESFNKTGMVVTATYSNGSTAAVTDYTVSPSAALTTSDTSVTISYTEGGVTKTATQAITVNPAAPTGGGIYVYIPPTYKVESELSEDADGTVTFSKARAKKGDTVTITVTPNRYYKVDGVTVKDALGNQIAVTDNGDGTFTFQMPDSKVAVEPVFSWDNPFTDVAEDTYYTPAVEWALKNEITDGTGDGTTFSPNAGCTRAQIVTFLWRAAGCPEPAGMSSFIDVSADAYYAKAVAWAVEQGITDGTGGGKFSPDAVCTRGQIVTFLWRAEKSPAVGTANPFTDVEADAYYADATNWAVENGITEGTGDGTTFSPANDCTRAQIVTFLYRYFVK